MRLSRTGLILLLALTISACGDDDSSTPRAEQLHGHTFKSTSIDGREMVAGTNVTISFDDDGLAVNAGCNTLVGAFEIDDGVLVVGTMAQTLMACTDDLMQQDQFLVGFLEAGPTVTLDKGTLTLVGENVTLTAEAID